MMTFRFALPERFQLTATVESHGWYRLAPFEWDRATATLRRAETFSGIGTVDLGINQKGSELLVRAEDRRMAEASRRRSIGTALGPRIRRMFQLHLDLAPFYNLCSTSPDHQKLEEDAFGRLLCGTTMFEDAVKIIATTNTRWAQTVRMVENLVEGAGGRAPSGRRAFPTPKQVVTGGMTLLRDECRMGYRAPYVLALAAGIVDGRLELDGLADPALPFREQIARFQLLPGIGPYGAAHLAAMEGRHEAIAVDSEFRRFVRERYFNGRQVSDRRLLKVYRRWGNWQYLGYWGELWTADRPGRGTAQ